MSNITFQVLRLSTFVLNKCSEIIIQDYVSGAGILKVTSIIQQSENNVQSPNAFSMTGQRRSLWVNIETVLVEWHVFVRSIYNRAGDRLVLGQRRRQLTGIEPAMGCNAGPTLNRNLVGRPTCNPLYQVHRDKYWMNVGQHRRWWWK